MEQVLDYISGFEQSEVVVGGETEEEDGSGELHGELRGGRVELRGGRSELLVSCEAGAARCMVVATSCLAAATSIPSRSCDTSGLRSYEVRSMACKLLHGMRRQCGERGKLRRVL
jgi:hypothetical protein